MTYDRSGEKISKGWRAAMTGTLLGSIKAGQFDDAVVLAVRHPVRWVAEQMSYDDVDEAAEQVSAFIERWLPELPPLERLEAANWATEQYVTAMVHVEHAYGIAARLLLEAQQGAAAALADSLRGFWILTDGPDAEISTAVAERLRAQAETLERMSFSLQGPASNTADLSQCSPSACPERLESTPLNLEY
jgi:hypothetical protein